MATNRYWEKHKNRQGDGITGCFNCQVRCMDYYDIAEMGPLVASCNIYASTAWVLKDSDMESWYAFASRCQRQGVDVMSAARMIAWAMELFESGQISTQDTDGLQLTWGNREAIGGMLDKIVKKEGFGNILSSTMDEIPRKIAKQVEVPLHIKGVPLGGTNVMNFRARAIGAAVNPRGSDEYRSRVGSFDDLGSGKDAGMTGMASPDSWEAQAAMNIIEKALKEKEKSGKESLITQFDYEGRGSLAALATKISAVSDALGQCKWNTVFLNLGVSIAFQANALSAGLGRDVSVEDLMESASRLTAQERAYAAREGYTREQDQLPEQLLNRQLPGTWPDDKLTPQGLESMKDDYYSAMGWHIETGIPTAETLHALKLDDVIEDLWTDTEKIAQ